MKVLVNARGPCGWQIRKGGLFTSEQFCLRECETLLIIAFTTPKWICDEHLPRVMEINKRRFVAVGEPE